MSEQQQKLTIEQAIDRGLQHHNGGRLPEAEKFYQQILQSEPNHPAALHLLGVLAHQVGKNEVAVDLISQALVFQPDLAEAHSNLGLALQALDRPEEAISSYHKALTLKPEYAAAHYNLGNTLQDLGNPEDAAASYRKALSLKPGYVEAHYNLGNALRDLDKLQEAVASYRKALALKPNYTRAHNNLGLTQQDIGQPGEAVTSYRKALSLKPGYVEAHYNLGNALRALDRPEEAVASYRKALALDPNFAEVHNNLGLALHDNGKLEEATINYHKALSLKPDFPQAHCNLGNALRQPGNLEGAIVSYREALAHDPNFAEAHSNLGLALQDVGNLEEAVICHQKALTIRPEYAEAHSNLIFTMSHIPETTGEEILIEAQRWNAQHGYRATISRHKNTPDPDRRLRIGLVSGDLRNHSISYFLKTILAEIDPEKLEVFAYSMVGKEDNETAWFRSIVTKWRKVVGTSNQELAQKIISDGIDILVDLSGHTAHNRLKMFSHKPAPIQVTWLGIGGTTGLTTMDYVLCDDVVLPPSDEKHFAEKPWRLPNIWVCFSPPNIDIDVGALPSLANGHLTFGCFNNLAKMTDPTVACWAKVLQAVPNSCLLLKTRQLNDDKVRQRVIVRFQDHGIGSPRLILEGSSPREELLASYQRVDIALDPFPHSGGATSLEALWMGVPFIALSGKRMQSSNGKSILQNVGLRNWVAATPQDYVEKTKTFAAAPTELAQLRQRLRTQLLASPVCDAIRFTRNLEDAFREMWKQWCNQQQT